MVIELTLDLMCPSCRATPVKLRTEIDTPNSETADTVISCANCGRSVDYGSVPVTVGPS